MDGDGDPAWNSSGSSIQEVGAGGTRGIRTDTVRARGGSTVLGGAGTPLGTRWVQAGSQGPLMGRAHPAATSPM